MPLVAIAVVAGAVLALLSERRTTAPTAGSDRHPETARPQRTRSTHFPVDRIDIALLSGGTVLSPIGLWVTSGLVSAVTTAVGYTLLAVYAWRQRTHPGMALVSVGLLANLAVIAVDGGMPVEGLAPGLSSGLHHGLTRADHLGALADVITLPALGLTASPGDLVLSLGAAIAAFDWVSGHRRQRVGGPTG